MKYIFNKIDKLNQEQKENLWNVLSMLGKIFTNLIFIYIIIWAIIMVCFLPGKHIIFYILTFSPFILFAIYHIFFIKFLEYMTGKKYYQLHTSSRYWQ